MLSLLLKGLIIGFAIAAPVGPIGILCIQRSLREGFKVGVLTGMGAATADVSMASLQEVETGLLQLLLGLHLSEKL
jgi:threonine/homoserine/homoserine lactone efflux protein